MDWKVQPTLKEFAEKFIDYVSDTGVLNNPEGQISSHKIVGDIRVIIDDDDDTVLEITGLEIDQLGGCGCSAGIVILVRKA